jgi:adhesin/invasin
MTRFPRRFGLRRAWRPPTGRPLAILAASAQLLVLAACGETGVSEPLAPSTVAAIAGNTQSGTAGQALANPIQVRVTGSDGQPLAGAQVTFSVTTGGGSVDPANAITDANGIASTRWTLGTTAGNNVLTATAGSASVTVAAAGTAGRAASVAATAGNNQSVGVNSPVPVAPSVRVTDANGNPVANVAVTFAVASGGGAITGALPRTNAQGVAAVSTWVLGPTAGAQTLSARVEESGIANNPILFTATAIAGQASVVTAASATTQTGTVGTPVAAPPSVRVTDAAGNPVPNVQVLFSVTLGNGQVSGNSQVTNAQGIATVGGWTLGPVAGAQEMTVTVASANAVVFRATAAAGAAAQMQISAGNNQRAQTTRPVAIAPSVVVRDALGNGVAGVTVTFSVASGGGSVVGARQVTDASGIAEVGGWFLGDTPGTNTLVAATPGVTGVVFTAVADPGRAVSMVANSSTSQTGTAGAVVAQAPSVVVRDLAGNPVSGVAVTFTVTAGGGTIVGSPATTNASGVATVTSWTLGGATGTNTVVASATGLPSVTFTATAGAGAPANVVAIAGNNQAAIQGTAVATQPKVRVTDALGNPVVGATVTFAVTAGGGSISGATQTTDAAGDAAVGSWTLGSAAPNTLTATVTGTGITGNPVVFTAQAATAISIASIPSGAVTLGASFVITAQLQNASAASVSLAGITLTVTIATGGGTLNGTLTAVTDANGLATFTLNVTGAAGARTFTVAGAGLTSATTAAITFN